jgi:uncharacterized protein (TIRG00374 family)
MSLKAWISIGTAVLMAVVLFLSRHELAQVWNLLFHVNLWILALILPIQALSYYASGASIFSYLKKKGELEASSFDLAKMALELNFVNHILPSGGVSGASYMTWRLNKIGVAGGRATMAQFVKFTSVFASYVVLLLIALVSITLDGSINRLIILTTSGLVSSILFLVFVTFYVVSSRSRLVIFSQKMTKVVNKWWRQIARRKKKLLKEETVEKFFEDLHEDYLILKSDPNLLIWPLVWGFVFNIAEIAMFFITFWALGSPINPATLLIGYGVASIAGFVMVTPGGAGGYEVLLISFLVSSGVNQGISVAAVLLARTILVLLTIFSGYIFYQLALNKYGRKEAEKLP